MPHHETLEARLLRAVDLAFVNGWVPGLFKEVVGEYVPIGGSFSLSNEGGTDSPAAIAYQVVLTTSPDSDDILAVLDEGTAPAIEAGGQSAAIEFGTDVNDLDPALLGHSYYVGVIIDPDDAIEESDENNRAVNPTPLHFATRFTGSTINGTPGNDDILVIRENDVLIFRGMPNAGNGFQMARPADVTSLTSDLLAGDDSFNVASNIDCPVTVNGGEGNDHLRTGGGDDSLVGGNGNDILDSRGGDDRLFGNAGRDHLQSGSGDDYLVGSENPDYLNGEEGNDTLLGQGGRDKLRGGEGVDLLRGGNGNDIFEDHGFAGIDIFSGNGGVDTAYADDDDLLSSIEILA